MGCHLQERPKNVVEAWRQELKDHGYEPPHINQWSKMQLQILSRKWRRILRHTKINRYDSMRFLEFGCGGGAQLIPLAAKYYGEFVGVDCSEEVLSRARKYLAQIKGSRQQIKGRVDLICQDFLDYKSEYLFDMTAQFGVLEHYLDFDERIQYLSKMFQLTKVDGFVVSAVPNGKHQLRSIQKKEKLGGYNIPEIDYSDSMLIEEMKLCGAKKIVILYHDLFGYLKLINNSKIKKIISKIMYLFFQIPIFQFFSKSFKRKHAYYLIAIAKK